MSGVATCKKLVVIGVKIDYIGMDKASVCRIQKSVKSSMAHIAFWHTRSLLGYNCFVC